MDFVNQSLKYFEDFFKTEILRYPHPSLIRMLNNLVFQAPENCHVIEEADLPAFEYEDIYRAIIGDFNLPAGTYSAIGLRVSDSMIRRISLKRYGPVNVRKKSFWPIYDWNKVSLMNCLREAGIRLPVDYQMFGRSFDGIDWRFLKPIMDRFPEDYKKILEYFPLAELEIKRREWRERYYG